jgi:hypothetical protein
MTIPKKHRALSYGVLAPGARFPTQAEARRQRIFRELALELHRINTRAVEVRRACMFPGSDRVWP